MSTDRSSTSDRETERIVRSWLTEGTMRLPDRVLDAVLDEVPSTPQRRAWWPARRFDTMSNTMRITIAAAAVLVIAFLFINILPGRNGGVGNPAASPSPSPTSAPTGEAAAALLTRIVVAPDAGPAGMSDDKTATGQITLARPFISRPVDPAMLAQQGFIDGRYTEFSSDAGSLLSWAVLFDTAEDAERSFALYLTELESGDGYGFGPGTEAGLGDQGTCGEGDVTIPNDAGDFTLHESICLWRSGTLVLAAGGVMDATSVRAIAEGMAARAAESP